MDWEIFIFLYGEVEFKVAEYNADFEHRAGNEIVVGDVLFRNTQEGSEI